MQGDAGILRQRLEELLHQLGVEGADLRPGKRHLEDQERPTGHVDRRAGQAFVHGEVEGGVAPDAAPLAERLADRLADGDAGVFHGVVIVDVQIAARTHRHVNQRVAR